jgi:cyclic pyranopterin phosphate synthase
MPEPEYTWLPRQELLDFEELSRLVDAFVATGVDRVRITGGEPLLRRDLPDLVRLIAAKPGVVDLALTTNGLLLRDQAQSLADAGLHRLTVSLDSLRAERFLALTGRDALADALAGIAAARATGLRDLKIDCVAMKGVNEDELVDLIRFAKANLAEVRFIEYMDVGGATRWTPDKVLSAAEMRRRIASELGPLRAIDGRGSAPAARYALEDGTTFGIVGSVTEPFCRDCDRSRVTADGMWLFCLYAASGIDLKQHLRAGESTETLAQRLRDRWASRSDRGAEERTSMTSRGPLVPVDALRRDPHREMHKRGG